MKFAPEEGEEACCNEGLETLQEDGIADAGTMRGEKRPPKSTRGNGWVHT